MNKVFLETEITTESGENHFKGVNIKKEIFRYNKQADLLRYQMLTDEEKQKFNIKYYNHFNANNPGKLDYSVHHHMKTTSSFLSGGKSRDYNTNFNNNNTGFNTSMSKLGRFGGFVNKTQLNFGFGGGEDGGYMDEEKYKNKLYTNLNFFNKEKRRVLKSNQDKMRFVKQKEEKTQKNNNKNVNNAKNNAKNNFNKDVNKDDRLNNINKIENFKNTVKSENMVFSWKQMEKENYPMKTSPNVNSFYYIINKKKQEILDFLREKRGKSPDKNILGETLPQEDEINEDQYKSTAFISINKKFSNFNFLEKKKNELLPVDFPIAYVHESDFISNSHANRYQKILQEFLNLKFSISKNFEKKDDIITLYLLKKGVKDFSNKEYVKKFFNFLFALEEEGGEYGNMWREKEKDKDNKVKKFTQDDVKINIDGNVSLLENIYYILGIKSKLSKEMEKKNLEVAEFNRRLDKIKSQKLQKLNSNKIKYSTNPLDHLNNTKTLLEDKEMIMRIYKKSPHDEVNKTTKKVEANELLKEISSRLKSVNLGDVEVEAFGNNEEFFDKERLYQRSIKPVPCEAQDILQNMNLSSNRLKYIQRKKLLEYVMLKELKHNNYYIDERRKLEEDVKLNLKGINESKKKSMKFLKKKLGGASVLKKERNNVEGGTGFGNLTKSIQEKTYSDGFTSDN